MLGHPLPNQQGLTIKSPTGGQRHPQSPRWPPASVIRACYRLASLLDSRIHAEASRLAIGQQRTVATVASPDSSAPTANHRMCGDRAL
jgi:hypothetical protein